MSASKKSAPRFQVFPSQHYLFQFRFERRETRLQQLHAWRVGAVDIGVGQLGIDGVLLGFQRFDFVGQGRQFVGFLETEFSLRRFCGNSRFRRRR